MTDKTTPPEVIQLDEETYNEVILHLTGAANLEEAQRAIAMGPRAWATQNGHAYPPPGQKIIDGAKLLDDLNKRKVAQP